jgi:hypothetical protein
LSAFAAGEEQKQPVTAEKEKTMKLEEIRNKTKDASDSLSRALESVLASKKIPALEPREMPALLHYMFHNASAPLRIQVAEVVFRYDRTHPNSLDLFLACVLPLAERAARRRAATFLHPSEWRIEAMYDGAVNLAIEMFHRGEIRGTADQGFRRYLLRTLAHGTSRYFMREENLAISSVTDVQTVRPFDRFRQGLSGRRHTALNTVEERMITKQLLDQVVNFPQLPDGPRATLQCIAALGPDSALKQHAFSASGDPDNWKRERGRRPILDPDAIAEAMKTNRQAVHYNLRQARIILQEVFNADGKLFQRR